MEFLRSLVPAVISGETPVEHGSALPKDSGPRLLRMKRLGLLSMGQTIEEDPIDPETKVQSRLSSSRPAWSNQTRLKGTKGLIKSACIKKILLAFSEESNCFTVACSVLIIVFL